ncbi:ankyrin repeat protein [Anaeramoeba flamelloides]|uniref:Ankyrin repeat protein n=1 Tax=Anaeramoeba flamelloides TaxID=1746091 RepID=A0AAV8A5H7_9EUKA|nr:ankyrin repeat protein [Anaeramoeba flamelloides]
MENIFEAVRNNDLEKIKYFLECNIPINTVSISGETLLHAACQDCSISVLDYLLKNGANPKILLPDGRNTIHVATEYGQLEKIKLLEKQGVPINTVDFYYGISPLHLAAQICNKEIVEYLIKKIHPDQAMFKNYTAVHIAARNGDLKCLKILTKYNANLEAKANYTALLIATENEHEKIIKYLLNEECDLNCKTKYLGNSCLHIACKVGNKKIVKLLIEQGININEVNKKKESGLHIAIRENHWEIIEILLESNIDLTLVSKSGKLAIEIAISHQEKKIQEMVSKYSQIKRIHCLNSSTSTLLIEWHVQDIFKDSEIYEVHHGHVDTPENAKILKVKQCNLKMAGLDQNTEYFFRVRPKKNGKWFEWSKLTIFRTELLTVPHQINSESIISIYNDENDTTKIKWMTPSENIDLYEITINSTIYKQSKFNEFIFEGQANMVSIRAHNQLGFGEWSNKVFQVPIPQLCYRITQRTNFRADLGKIYFDFQLVGKNNKKFSCGGNWDPGFKFMIKKKKLNPKKKKKKIIHTKSNINTNKNKNKNTKKIQNNQSKTNQKNHNINNLYLFKENDEITIKSNSKQKLKNKKIKINHKKKIKNLNNKNNNYSINSNSNNKSNVNIDNKKKPIKDKIQLQKKKKIHKKKKIKKLNGEVEDRHDGTYRFSFWCNKSGHYIGTVLFNKEIVSGSTFEFNIIPGKFSLQHSDFVIRGKNSITLVGDKLKINFVFRDKYLNRIPTFQNERIRCYFCPLAGEIKNPILKFENGIYTTQVIPLLSGYHYFLIRSEDQSITHFFNIEPNRNLKMKFPKIENPILTKKRKSQVYKLQKSKNRQLNINNNNGGGGGSGSNNNLNPNQNEIFYQFENNLLKDNYPRNKTFGTELLGMKINLKIYFNINQQSIQLFLQDIDCLASISHPACGRFIGCTYINYWGEKRFCLIWKAIKGSPLSSIQNKLQVSNKLKILLSISKVMKYLHGKNICHYQLKPSNIYIPNTKKDNVIIKNFGFQYVLQQKLCSTKKTKSFKFLDPKLKSVKEYTYYNDVYSFGILMKYLLIGNLEKSMNSKFYSLQQLIEECTNTIDPLSRPSFKMIYTRLKQIIDKILHFSFFQIDKFELFGTIHKTSIKYYTNENTISLFQDTSKGSSNSNNLVHNKKEERSKKEKRNTKGKGDKKENMKRKVRGDQKENVKRKVRGDKKKQNGLNDKKEKIQMKNTTINSEKISTKEIKKNTRIELDLQSIPDSSFYSAQLYFSAKKLFKDFIKNEKVKIHKITLLLNQNLEKNFRKTIVQWKKKFSNSNENVTGNGNGNENINNNINNNTKLNEKEKNSLENAVLNYLMNLKTSKFNIGKAKRSVFVWYLLKNNKQKTALCANGFNSKHFEKPLVFTHYFPNINKLKKMKNQFQICGSWVLLGNVLPVWRGNAKTLKQIHFQPHYDSIYSIDCKLIQKNNSNDQSVSSSKLDENKGKGKDKDKELLIGNVTSDLIITQNTNAILPRFLIDFSFK